MIKRKSFCEFGAYAVNVLDPSKIVVMTLRTAGDLGGPISRTVTLDFTKILKPQSSAVADYDAAELDALGVEPDGSDKIPAPQYPHTDGLNVLTVGPVFPPGPHVGGILCERTKFYRDVRPVMDPAHDQWPAYRLRTYQIMTTATFDTTGNTLRRYHGFHAKVVADAAGIKTLEIEGKTVSNIDLDDRLTCDDPAALAAEIVDPDHPAVPLTVLTKASAVGAEGAVFLALPFAAHNDLRQGKAPPGGGWAVGSTESDVFAESVFALSLSRSRKVDLRATSLAAIRAELVQQIETMGLGDGNFDIVGDSPGGQQLLGTQKLFDVFFDRSAPDEVRRLAQLIRSRFARCRLLGCYTALSPQSRSRMLHLAEILRIPVLGTTRAISWSDFGKYGFTEFQTINGVRTTILKSTEHMSNAGKFDEPTEERLASGWYQEMWLRRFDQVPLELTDVRRELPELPTVRVPSAMFEPTVATTDQILLPPEATVMLQTESRVTIPAQLLASATLLRLRSRNHGAVYLNVPPTSTLRQDLSQLAGR